MDPEMDVLRQLMWAVLMVQACLLNGGLSEVPGWLDAIESDCRTLRRMVLS